MNLPIPNNDEQKSEQQLPIHDTDAEEEAEELQESVTEPIAIRSERRSCGSCPSPARVKNVKNVESDSTEVESSTDIDERFRDVSRTEEMPDEYYTIQKLVKFTRAGSPLATMVSLCFLQDYDLKEQISQYAIQDVGGLHVLVNILESKHYRPRIEALNVLSEMSSNIDIRKTIVDLGAVPLIVEILKCAEPEIKTKAADCLAIVCKVRLARKFVRTSNGIPKLLDLLDIDLETLITPPEELDSEDEEYLEMARSGGCALWRLAESRHNKVLMRKSGIVPLIARILKTVHIDVVVPIMGTIQKCAGEPQFQLAIATEGMVDDIVRHIRSDSVALKISGSTTLYYCCIDETTRKLVREANGLEPLVDIIKDETERDNQPLMAGATGAIWMCAVSDENVELFDNLGTIPALVKLLDHFDDDVLTYTAGAIAECVRFQNSRESLRLADGLPLLVSHLYCSHSPLLINLAKGLGECSEDSESMRILEDLDALPKIFSLLNNTDTKVQETAAYAICLLIKNALGSGELVRNCVYAIETCVNLLISDDINVLTAICAVIARIALDRSNRAILTDLKVIFRLAKLVKTTDDRLRETLAAAIANCASYGDNIKILGLLHTVTPIVSFLGSENPKVHHTTALALEKLSANADNCIEMHRAGVVPFLMDSVNTEDKVLQLAAANCIRNIRLLGLHTEKHIYKVDEDLRGVKDRKVFFPKKYIK